MRITNAACLVVIPVLVLMASCGRAREEAAVKTNAHGAAVTNRTDMPLYDLYLENRSSKLVAGWLQFGDLLSVAGGYVGPGEVSAHQDLSGGVAPKASIEMTLLPPGTKDFRHATGETRTAEVPVKSQLPPNFY